MKGKITRTYIDFGQIDTTPIIEAYPIYTKSSAHSNSRPKTKHPTADVQLAAWIVAGKRWAQAENVAEVDIEIEEAKRGKNYAGVIL